MNENAIYKSPFKERSHASTPLFTLIGLAALTAYFMYSQDGVIDSMFLIFAGIGVLIVTLIAISYSSFDIYKDEIELYKIYNRSAKKTIPFSEINKVELLPASYNDWSINRISLHLNNGKEIKLDGGNKYIEVLKAFNQAGYKIAIKEKKKKNFNADKAIRSGVNIE